MSISSPGPKPVLPMGLTTGVVPSAAAASAGEANTDANAATATGLIELAYNYGFNGATWDRVRLANTFNTVIATAAGNTAVWTPGAGNFFRLMGYTISVSGTFAATGTLTVQLRDVALVKFQHEFTVTITTPTGDTQIGVDLGQGYLSAAAGDVLNVNLSGALLTGGCAVNVWGTQGPTA